MLATPGRHIPAGDAWAHEVKWDGIRVLADSRDGLDRFLSRNGNDVTAAWPDLATSPLPGRDLLGRRRGDRTQRGGASRLPGAAGADARALGVGRGPAGEAGAGHVHGLRPAPPRRHRPHRRAARASPRAARRPDGGRALAGAHVVRRRADALRGDRPAGPGGDRQQAALVALRLRGADAALAEVRAPPPGVVRRRRLAAAGGRHPPGRPARRRAHGRGPPLPWPGGQWHRAEGQQAAHRRAGGRTVGPTARSPTRCRGSTRSGAHWVDPVLVVDIDTHPHGRAERLRQPSYQGIRRDLTPDDL